MQRSASNWFNNLSVRTKLASGFSILLVMILLIAYTGWQAAVTLADRSDRMRDIANFNTVVRDMRIERLVYLDDASDAQATEWLNALEATEKQLRSISPSFSSRQNVALLTKASDLLKRYRGFYDQVVAATREREGARKTATVTAEQVNTLLYTLWDTANAENGRYQDRQLMTKLSFNVQKMRLAYRSYAESPDKAGEDQARTAINGVLESVSALQASGLPAEAVQALQTQVQQYMKCFEQTLQTQSSVDAAQTGITKLIASVLQLSDELTGIQAEFQKSDISEVNRAILIGLCAAVALSLFAAWFITRSIVAPLRETVDIAETVAKGDFSHRLTVTRTDEIGALQSSMNRMTLNLQGLVSELKDGVIQVASAAEQLSTVTEQTSAGVQSQKVETDQIATAMQQMTATIHEVARNAGQAATSAQDASSKAAQGDSAVDKAVEQIERLAEEMASAKSVMTSLRANADSIGGVLDVIQSVSEQTNLLALNAAIEAARAGEAGRGFAVVADEVRGLAQRTRASTDEINQLIAELNDSTDRMAAVLEQNVQLTDNSVDASRAVGQVLKQIAGSVREILSMNEQIACAAEQQSAAGEQISRSVTNVRDISDQTATSSEETASSSFELARISVHLQEMASRFKV